MQEGVEHYRSGEATVTLDWYAPAARGKFPAVVMLHGSGGLDVGTDAVFRATARGFAERGYVALVPHYFERTDHVAGKPVRGEDFTAFIKAVNDAMEFGATSGLVDPDRIAILGYSMGATIAFHRAVRDPRLKAIVSVAGHLPVGSQTKYPPVLILQGSKDPSNPPANVKTFEEQLKSQGTPYASHVYRGMGHNFDLERWDAAAGRAVAFLDRHMRSPKDAKTRKRNADAPARRPNRTAKPERTTIVADRSEARRRKKAARRTNLPVFDRNPA